MGLLTWWYRKTSKRLGSSFPRKEKKLPLAGHDLHEHLIKKLISEVGFSMIIPLSSASAVYFTNLERQEQKTTTTECSLHSHPLGFWRIAAYCFWTFPSEEIIRTDYRHLGRLGAKRCGCLWEVWQETERNGKFISRYPNFRKLWYQFQRSEETPTWDYVHVEKQPVCCFLGTTLNLGFDGDGKESVWGGGADKKKQKIPFKVITKGAVDPLIAVNGDVDGA